jgi:HAD superfamily hydrolase (TIGR01509 family)
VSLPAAVLFDNDGLLLDTETIWTRAEGIMFERRKLEFTAQNKRELIGASAERAGAILADRLGEPGSETELIAELDRLVFEEIEAGVEPMAGARELVAELGARGVAMGLVSNAPLAFLERVLALVEMKGVFGAVVSGHDVQAPKPAPHPYLAACEVLGVEPAKSVALEDSATGVASARAAGMVVVGVPSFPGVELHEADTVVSSLQDPALARVLGLDG